MSTRRTVDTTEPTETTGIETEAETTAEPDDRRLIPLQPRHGPQPKRQP